MLNRVKKSSSRDLLRSLPKTSFSELFGLWILVILFFGVLYFLFLSSDVGYLMYDGQKIQPDLKGFGNSIYYSFITATATGYGDIVPFGLLKFIVIIEVIVGLLFFGTIISKLVSSKQEIILEELYEISFEDRVNKIHSNLSSYRKDIKSQLIKLNEGLLTNREIGRLWLNFLYLDEELIKSLKILYPLDKSQEYVKIIDDEKIEILVYSLDNSLNVTISFLEKLNEYEIKWHHAKNMSTLDSIKTSLEHVLEHNVTKKVEDRIDDAYNSISKNLDKLKKEIKIKVDIEESDLKNWMEKTETQEINK